MRWSWLAVAAVSLVLVAGCSNGKSTAAATTTTTVAANTTTTASTASAYCDVARQFSPAVNSATLNNLRAAFQQFDTFAPRYLSVVPPSIKGDAVTVVAAVRQVEASIKAVNYDVTKVTAADLAPVEAPSFTAATNAITSYDSQVCGVTPPTT